jgi:hypothetical protein
MLAPYGRAFDENNKKEYGAWVRDISRKLRLIALILHSGEIDVGIRPRGAPVRETFREAIGILVEICKPRLTELYRNPGRRITFLVIAEILICAFPEKFNRKTAVKLVQDGYRQWCRDHGGKKVKTFIALVGKQLVPFPFTVPQPKPAVSRRKRSGSLKGDC